MSLVYVESALLDHPYTLQVLGRLKRAEVVEIDHYLIGGRRIFAYRSKTAN